MTHDDHARAPAAPTDESAADATIDESAADATIDEPAADATIDRRTYLRAAGGVAVAGVTGLAGCTDGDAGAGGTDDGTIDGGEPQTGVLATRVTDQPNDIGDFESCVVRIEGIWLGPRTDGAPDEDDDGGQDDGDEERAEQGDGTDQSSAATSAATPAGSQSDDEDGDEAGEDQDDGDEESGEDQDDGDDGADGGDEEDDGGDEEDDEHDDGAPDEDEEDGGRTYYAFDEPQSADLVELQDETTQLVDDREVPVGTYQYLQLDVDGVEGTLTDGTEAVVETPGNAPLKFQQSFEVRAGYRTGFTADLAPFKRGNGEYLIRPVASGVEVTYEPLGEGDDGDGENRDDDADGGDGENDGSEEDGDDGNEEDGDDGNEEDGDDGNEEDGDDGNEEDGDDGSSDDEE